MRGSVQYSIIVPVYKAEKTLSVLIPRLVRCMSSFTESFEIILVDDRSPDRSWIEMNNLLENYPQLRLFRFTKNFGQLAATTCGVHNANGHTIITMDDDLQFAPEDLPDLIRYFESNEYVLVFGVPFRKYNSFQLYLYRNIARLLFNYFFLFPYRHIEYFSSLRILSASKIHDAGLNNLFKIWQLKPSEIGNFMVNSYPTTKEKTSYTLLKRIVHFSPYIIFSVRQTGLFLIIASLFALAVLFLLKEYHYCLAYIFFLAAFGFSISVTAFLLLKKSDKIIYEVESMYP